jgi:hypothetical protein
MTASPSFSFLLFHTDTAASSTVSSSTTLASAVTLSTAAQSLTAYTSASTPSTTTTKSFQLNFASDPHGYPVIYTKISETFGGSSTTFCTVPNTTPPHYLVYTLSKAASRSGSVVVQAQNLYVTDTAKRCTFTITESYITAPAVTTSISQTRYSSSIKTTTQYEVTLPTTDSQSLALTWTLQAAGTISSPSVPAPTNGVYKFLYRTQGSSSTSRTSTLRASMPSAIATESGVQGYTDVTFTLVEKFMNSILSSTTSPVSISYTSNFANRTQNYQLPSTDQGDALTWSPSNNGIWSNVSIDPTTKMLSWSTRGVTTSSSPITLTASFSDTVMSETGFTARSITYNITETYVLPTLSLPSSYDAYFNITILGTNLWYQLPEKDQNNVTLTWTYVRRSDNIGGATVNGNIYLSFAFYNSTPNNVAITLRASATGYASADRVFTMYISTIVNLGASGVTRGKEATGTGMAIGRFTFSPAVTARYFHVTGFPWEGPTGPGILNYYTSMSSTQCPYLSLYNASGHIIGSAHPVNDYTGLPSKYATFFNRLFSVNGSIGAINTSIINSTDAISGIAYVELVWVSYTSNSLSSNLGWTPQVPSAGADCMPYG